MIKIISAICAVLFIMLGAVSCTDDVVPNIMESSQETPGMSESEGESDTLQQIVVYDEMKPDDGYSVISQIIFDVNVTEDGTQLKRKARIACLKDANDNNGLYLDVLDTDGKIMCSKQWAGFGQIFFDAEDEDKFIVFRIGTNNKRNGQIACEYYRVTDVKITMLVGNYSEEQLDHIQILNDPRMDKATFNFNMTDDPQMLMKYRMNFINFFHKYENILIDAKEENENYYLVADNFLDKNEVKLFEPCEKEPHPDFDVHYKKYSPEYLVDLFS